VDALEHIDIEAEVTAHRSLESFYSRKTQIEECQRWVRTLDQEIGKLLREQTKLQADIELLNQHRCHACGQDLHDHKQDQILGEKATVLAETQQSAQEKTTQKQEYQNELDDLGALGIAPTVFYDNLEQALNHRNSLENLRKDHLNRTQDQDPYQEQIEEMQQQALQEVSYDTINELTRLQEHQDFLLKLLTSKDSFVRKKIIDQNLSYLNSRLTYYLDAIGLPHQVKFQNDLSVEISELGRELDFDNLSRGERNRLILSLSWAFRDVFESLYTPVNLLFIDELLDSGLDTAGMEAALGILKGMARERNKSVWLVSHRDELAGRVENIL
jgi:DNA repair exonuclease SbcCD ATPase subunit